jgi:hypothetical protein
MVLFSDDQIPDSIPVPETVGVDAAKRLHDGRFGGMFKNLAKYDIFQIDF